MNPSDWQVVVVEDEYDSVQLISKILRFHGAQVHIVNNGQECLELLDRISPTFIVTDLAMPRMDGWETLAAVRANATTANIPVVAMTAYHSVDVAEEVIQAGFDAYFPKPVDPQSFVQNLARLLAP